MNRLKRISLCAILNLTFGLGVGVNLASAESAPATAMKIGTIEMQKAIESVNIGKKARDQLEKEYNLKKKMLQDEDNAIKKLIEEFKKQSLALNDDAKMKKQQEIQERASKFQESIQKSEMEVRKRESDLTAPIVSQIKEVIQEQAKKNNYDLVLDRNQNNGPVLFSKDEHDLTKIVIDEFNKKYK